MRLQPWLCFAGTELANGNRTLSYVRSECLGWDLFDCDCAVLDEEVWVDPATDPAPWYDGTLDSAEFLGLYPDNIVVRSVLRREISDRGLFGGSVGRLYELPRSVVISGIMYAKSDIGLYYGERWIEEVLSGSLCSDGCSNDELELLAACDVDYYRKLFKVGIADEPTYEEPQGQHDFTFQRVSFQLVAGVPYLYGLPVAAMDGQSVNSMATQRVLVEASEWQSGASMVIQITAGSSGASDVTVSAKVALSGSCPETRTPDCLNLIITSLQANSKILIDATRQEVLWYDPILLQWKSGMHLITFLGSFPWPEAAPCTDLCVSVANGGSTTITADIDVYRKER